MHRVDDQFRIGNMTVRNRLVLPPLTTNYGTEKGLVTPEIKRFYRARSGHMGVVIVEAAAVSPEGRIVPGSIGLWDDSQIPGMGELADLTNQRKDKYGGSTEGRAALAVEIVRAVREKLGPEYPVFFRLNVRENLEGGMTPDEAVAVGKLMARAGADVLDLSLAVQGIWKEEEGTRILITTSAYAKDQDTGGVTELAGRFRDVCGLPVIAVGRLGSRDAAEQALGDGADMVDIGRQMICDPKTAEKILAGKEDEILACEACMACFASLGKGKPLGCKVNSRLPD